MHRILRANAFQSIFKSSRASRFYFLNAKYSSGRGIRLLIGGKHFSTQSIESEVSADSQQYEFQAETRKLLDIVTHSIYTDKEVFIRELISNASDALEKRRYKQVTGGVVDPAPLEINILTDETNNTLTISDNGIGMSKDDLVSNLGTIARSGSKQFVEQLKSDGLSRDGDAIIGQFGIGFYSSFMVAKEVLFDSKPATIVKEGEVVSSVPAHTWKSDGSGKYSVFPSEKLDVGSKITLHLKDETKEYSRADRIKECIKKYSNFVSFPIVLNGQVVNTVSAIWTQDKSAITKAQYEEFYKFISNAYDTPMYTLHFRTDAPIDLKALFFIPTSHGEKYGMARLEPGINLYSRKVLIETKPKDILPDWLR